MFSNPPKQDKRLGHSEASCRGWGHCAGFFLWKHLPRATLSPKNLLGTLAQGRPWESPVVKEGRGLRQPLDWVTIGGSD